MARGLEPTEDQIELLLLDYLVRIRKILAWKNPSAGRYDPHKKRFVKSKEANNPYARNGVSDIIAIFKGVTLFIEVKSKAGRQNDDQKSFERDLRAAGGFYYLVRSLDELEVALDEVEKIMDQSLSPKP